MKSCAVLPGPTQVMNDPCVQRVHAVGTAHPLVSYWLTQLSYQVNCLGIAVSVFQERLVSLIMPHSRNLYYIVLL